MFLLFILQLASGEAVDVEEFYVKYKGLWVSVTACLPSNVTLYTEGNCRIIRFKELNNGIYLHLVVQTSY